MSVQTKQKTSAFDPQLIKQLLSSRKTAGKIADLRKAFVESALEGELMRLLGNDLSRAGGKISQKWTMLIKNGKAALQQFAILY